MKRSVCIGVFVFLTALLTINGFNVQRTSGENEQTVNAEIVIEEAVNTQTDDDISNEQVKDEHNLKI